MITKAESNMLERVLKTGLRVIFQSEYKSFNQCLKLANMKSLKSRRTDIVFKFSKRAENHELFSQWFTMNNMTRSTRSEKPKYKPVTTRTSRYARSSIPVITEALSWHPPKNCVKLNLH